MNSLAHFRGCIYGALMGDVYGAPFELKHTIKLQCVLDFINNILLKGSSKELTHTDDTVMSFGICESLMRKGEFDASDLARTFASDFFKAPACRLYGSSIRGLFKLMQENDFKNAFEVAAAQFGGTGSFGNGTGMRISPAALFGLALDTTEFNRLILQVSAVTHAHPLALYGALLQAHTIRRILLLVLSSDKPTIDAKLLLEQLMDDLRTADIVDFCAGKKAAKDRIVEALHQYQLKIGKIEYLLAQPISPSVETVVRELGNGEPALEAIPTALYVFLKCLDNSLQDISFESLPLRCEVYAISLGYDTDTIGSMACALAGAFAGADLITDAESIGTVHFPTKIMSSCEGLELANVYVDWLFDHYMEITAAKK